MSAILYKNFLMLLAVRISSYGCTWEVWRALKKLELLSAAPRATLTHLSCSPKFPRASITRYTLAKRGDEWSLRAFKCSQRPFVTPLSERIIREHASTEIFFASTSRDKKFALQAASGLESATREQGALLILSVCSNPYGKPFL